jgi:dTDP-4-amino-4,6-dideoxygalactose transaminase
MTKEDSELKCSIEDLAIFGGAAAFRESLHVGRPNIGNRERLTGRINDLLDRGYLTNRGPYVQEFERRIADMFGVKHCIAICNGTVALEIAIRAAGLTGEVIVPSMTFIATAHALLWEGIAPVFCDIDPLTHNLDAQSVEQMITSRTKGIIGVHLWGRPCDVEALSDIAHCHNLKLLFDAAHAFGCSYNGAMIGNFGDAEIFSFHATKFINTFEGGAVVTNDDELASKMRLMKNFGFAGLDNVVYIGTNGKMSEMSAAMGLTSLESMQEFIAVNYRNYKQYLHYLSKIPGITMLTYNGEEKNNYQYIVLEIDEGSTYVNRDQLKDILWAENILARRYFYPGCHRMEPYRSLFPQAGLLLPNTERLVNRVLSLPTGTSIGPDDIEKICGIIHFVVKHVQEIRERLIKKANKNNP